MLDESILNDAARAAHEANAAYCSGIGDHSQPCWTEAPEWQRESAKAGVRAIYDNPSMGPSAQHDSWLAEKERDGWKWGPVKDAEKKEHPCFVPYSDLPESQKAKDAIFGAVVRGVLYHHGALPPK